MTYDEYAPRSGYDSQGDNPNSTRQRYDVQGYRVASDGVTPQPRQNRVYTTDGSSRPIGRSGGFNNAYAQYMNIQQQSNARIAEINAHRYSSSSGGSYSSGGYDSSAGYDNDSSSDGSSDSDGAYRAAQAPLASLSVAASIMSSHFSAASVGSISESSLRSCQEVRLGSVFISSSARCAGGR